VFENPDWRPNWGEEPFSEQIPTGKSSRDKIQNLFFLLFSEKNFFSFFIFKNPKMKRITLSHSGENFPGASRPTKTLTGVLIGTDNWLSWGEFAVDVYCLVVVAVYKKLRHSILPTNF
jgi:hypothetical protein